MCHAHERSDQPHAPERSIRLTRIAKAAEPEARGRRRALLVSPNVALRSETPPTLGSTLEGSDHALRDARTRRERRLGQSRRTAFRIAKAMCRDDTTSGGRYQTDSPRNSSGRNAVCIAGSLTLTMLELLVRVDDANTFRAYPNAYYVVSSADDAGSALGEHDLP